MVAAPFGVDRRNLEKIRVLREPSNRPYPAAFEGERRGRSFVPIDVPRCLYRSGNFGERRPENANDDRTHPRADSEESRGSNPAHEARATPRRVRMTRDRFRARPPRPRHRVRVHSLAVAGVLFALVVSSIALPLAATPAAAQQSGAPGAEANGTDIVVRQDGQCYPMRAFGNGTTSVQEFYSYRSPYTEPRGWYRAYGELQGLLRQDTSQVLLYNGSEGLSLVFVHDGLANESGSGGTVAMDITGLPPGGNWSVRDDTYPGQDDVFELRDTSAHI
ncbi:hypothetical protein BRC77_03375, partial [Halobacteriales archaeon QH_8_64_26]